MSRSALPSQPSVATASGMAVCQMSIDREELSQVILQQNAQLRALNEANLLISEERLVSSSERR